MKGQGRGGEEKRREGKVKEWKVFLSVFLSVIGKCNRVASVVR
jgi:hypothetical protein